MPGTKRPEWLRWLGRLLFGFRSYKQVLWALRLVAACLTYTSLNGYSHPPPTVSFSLS